MHRPTQGRPTRGPQPSASGGLTRLVLAKAFVCPAGARADDDSYATGVVAAREISLGQGRAWPRAGMWWLARPWRPIAESRPTARAA